MLIFGFYIAQNNKNPHVTLFKHCISKTARYSILTPLVKKSYLGDKLLNPEYQVIGSESVNTPPGPSMCTSAFCNPVSAVSAGTTLATFFLMLKVLIYLHWMLMTLLMSLLRR